MNIFSLFTLCGGLAFFLFGMSILSSGLEKMTGGRLEKALKKMTSSPIKSLLLGAGVTVAIQSSSAMTVMLVGFVNSGIMELGQTVGVIMGSNVGTTLTAWILSLAGIESDQFLIQLLKPEAFAPIIALVGIILIMGFKDTHKKDIGGIMLGFSILMYGMTLMSDAVSPLADIPEFGQILVAFNNPWLGVLAGALFTGVVQSSAASVGILQALSLTGNITFGMAIPIIMGQNIGTCVTALLSSIGVNINAKRVAIVHIYFNLIGTLASLAILGILSSTISLPFLEEAITPVWIAAAHSLFNLFTTLMLLPFTKQLERLAKWTIKDKNVEEQYTLLDERLLLTPSVAIAASKEHTINMAKLVQENLSNSLSLIKKYDEQVLLGIEQKEELIDEYEDKLGTFLVRLSSRELSDEDSKEVSKVLHIIGDFERIGDHALNIGNTIKGISQQDRSFSKEATEEMIHLSHAVNDIVNMSFTAMTHNDLSLAKQVEPLEEVIDYLNLQLKKKHIDRLKEGKCTIEQGLAFNDIINDCERVSDHCSNIAVCLIQINEANFDTHEYLHDIKSAEKGPFMEYYQYFREKYDIF